MTWLYTLFSSSGCTQDISSWGVVIVTCMLFYVIIKSFVTLWQ